MTSFIQVQRGIAKTPQLSIRHLITRKKMSDLKSLSVDDQRRKDTMLTLANIYVNVCRATPGYRLVLRDPDTQKTLDLFSAVCSTEKIDGDNGHISFANGSSIVVNPELFPALPPPIIDQRRLGTMIITVAICIRMCRAIPNYKIQFLVRDSQSQKAITLFSALCVTEEIDEDNGYIVFANGSTITIS